jgi:hypothetical protein
MVYLTTQTIADYRATKNRIGEQYTDKDVGGICCGRSVWCHPSIWPEDLRDTFRQDSRSLGRDLNLRPFKYEAAVLTTRPRRSVFKHNKRGTVIFCAQRLSLISKTTVCGM